ncbi:MAG: MBL fold metallo-hydrolase [Desulforegulaceae bacterium]|nr:MBL fold metallo-hydrolase [Desulforegulaceae bacterium]
MQKNYPEIIPIKIGNFSVRFQDLGVKLPSIENIPCFVFLIKEKNNSPILVDTGFSPFHVPGSGSDFKIEKSLEQSLEDLGYFPKDIKKIIMTHLHWDHTGNLPLFKNADIYVNKDEITGLLHLMPNEETYFAPDYFVESLDRFILTNHSFKISENIEIVKTGFHSFGHQVVKVRTNGKTIVLAGDAPFSYSDLWKIIPDFAWEMYRKEKGKQFYWKEGISEKIVKFLEKRKIENSKPFEMKAPVFEKDDIVYIAHDTSLDKTYKNKSVLN